MSVLAADSPVERPVLAGPILGFAARIDWKWKMRSLEIKEENLLVRKHKHWRLLNLLLRGDKHLLLCSSSVCHSCWSDHGIVASSFVGSLGDSVDGVDCLAVGDLTNRLSGGQDGT